jgi:hypothetical protein
VSDRTTLLRPRDLPPGQSSAAAGASQQRSPPQPALRRRGTNALDAHHRLIFAPIATLHGTSH